MMMSITIISMTIVMVMGIAMAMAVVEANDLDDLYALVALHVRNDLDGHVSHLGHPGNVRDPRGHVGHPGRLCHQA